MPNIVNVGYRSTNYYALDIRGGKLLVDCGWPGTLAQFTAAMIRKGISPSDIKYILATHYHPDHAGLVEDFKRLGAQLILMESQTGALNAPAPAPGKTPALIHVSHAGNLLLEFGNSREFLAAIGLQGEIIPTPGHSPDSVALLLDDGSAFTGDLPPRTFAAETDEALLSSWRALDERGARRFYPAHGA